MIIWIRGAKCNFFFKLNKVAKMLYCLFYCGYGWQNNHIDIIYRTLSGIKENGTHDFLYFCFYCIYELYVCMCLWRRSPMACLRKTSSLFMCQASLDILYVQLVIFVSIYTLKKVSLIILCLIIFTYIHKFTYVL